MISINLLRTDKTAALKYAESISKIMKFSKIVNEPGFKEFEQSWKSLLGRIINFLLKG